jgi:glyoxylase-like metal-dependent hydrolase (beta-lactamase superfamily II)
MRIINLYPGSWGSNCYLLISGTHAAVVDPSPKPEQILNLLQQEGAALEYILLTHGHFDHIVSLDALRQITGVPALIHEQDAELPSDAVKNGFRIFFHMDKTYQVPDQTLHADQVLKLGDEKIRVIHTPGHTAGSVCYLCNGEFLLTGDTLFDAGRGRTDLYGGNEAQLMQTLEAMRSLPQSLPIYPGHGSPATLGIALDNVIY